MQQEQNYKKLYKSSSIEGSRLIYINFIN